MTSREIFLLRLLAVIAGAAIVFMGGGWLFSNLSRLDQELRLNTQRLSQLNQRQNELSLDPNAAQSKHEELSALKDEVEALSQRFIEPGPIDVYAFANRMRAIVRQSGLSLEQMQIDDVKKRVSFQVSGSTLRALSMLSLIEQQDNFLTVWNLSFDAGGLGSKDETHMTMTVGYAERT